MDAIAYTYDKNANTNTTRLVVANRLTGIYPLADGGYIVDDHGKYGSGLLLIVRRLVKDDAGSPYIYVYDASVSVIDAVLPAVFGTFFTTKKGKPAFRVDPNGPHALVRDSFDGCRGYDSRIDRLKDADRLYYKRSLSNGGGAGDIYAVVSRDLHATFDVDDL